MQIEELKLRMHEQSEHDSSFVDFVEDLLKTERLDGKAVMGIGKKIVSDGVKSLSANQLETFIKYGLYPYNYIEECENCGSSIPWAEMLFALDDSYCDECRYKLEKND
ncbi:MULTISPECIES: hypothetical protein [Bacillus]|uniref:hypothetical protein n=1 Tax=Bacillus TaxID=1386 RepID=UPI0030F7E980